MSSFHRYISNTIGRRDISIIMVDNARGHPYVRSLSSSSPEIVLFSQIPPLRPYKAFLDYKKRSSHTIHRPSSHTTTTTSNHHHNTNKTVVYSCVTIGGKGEKDEIWMRHNDITLVNALMRKDSNSDSSSTTTSSSSSSSSSTSMFPTATTSPLSAPTSPRDDRWIATATSEDSNHHDVCPRKPCHIQSEMDLLILNGMARPFII